MATDLNLRIQQIIHTTVYPDSDTGTLIGVQKATARILELVAKEGK